MSDEEILPCVMCDQHHEQMLMLTCMHDPCINCAAVHYCSTQPNTSQVAKHSTQVYICAKCGEYTELDSSSVTELQRVYHLLKVFMISMSRGKKDMTIAGIILEALTLAAIPTHRICTLSRKYPTNIQRALIMIPIKSLGLLDTHPKSLIPSQTNNTNQQHIHLQFPSPTLLFLNPAIIIPTM